MSDKKYDFSDFEDEKVDKKSTYDFSDFEDKVPSDYAQDLKDIAQGVASGATFGTSDILQGVALAPAEMISSPVDALTRAEMQSNVEKQQEEYNKKRAAKGLPEEQVVDKTSALKDLINRYYEAKDIASSEREKSAERSPALYTTGAVGGSLISAPAGLAAGASSRLAKTVLPQFKPAMKLNEVMAQGAKAGVLAGAGEGESKLLEGDVGGTLKEAGFGAGTGLAAGVIGKGLESTVKGVTSILPKQKWGVAKDYASVEGKDLSSSQVLKDQEEFAKKVMGTLSSKYSELGGKRQGILDLAEESGMSVNIGDKVKATLDKLNKIYPETNEEAAELEALKSNLTRILGVNKPTQKLMERAEKDILKAELKGSPLEQEIGTQEGFVTSKLVTPEGTVRKADVAKGQLPSEATRTSEQASKLVSSLNDVANNLKSTELKRTMSTLTQDLNKNVKQSLDDMAKESGLDYTYSDVQKQFSDIFSGVKSVGLDKEDMWKNLRPEDYNDAITKLATKSVKDTDKEILQKKQFFESLRNAGIPEANALESEAQKLADLSVMAKLSDADQSLLSKTGLFRLSGKAANIAGKAQKSTADYFKSIQDSIVNNNTSQAVIEKIRALPGADKFKNALDALSTAPSVSKKAALTFGLMQNPAFKALFDQVTGEVKDENEQ